MAEPERRRPLPVKRFDPKPIAYLAWIVEAYAKPGDETAGAVFEVVARTRGEAMHLVLRDARSKQYLRLEAKAHDSLGVIAFTMRPSQ